MYHRHKIKKGCPIFFEKGTIKSVKKTGKNNKILAMDISNLIAEKNTIKISIQDVLLQKSGGIKSRKK